MPPDGKAVRRSRGIRVACRSASPPLRDAWRTLAAAAGLAGHFDVAAEALVQIKRLQPNVSLDWIEKYHPIVHSRGPRHVHGRLASSWTGLARFGLTELAPMVQLKWLNHARICSDVGQGPQRASRMHLGRYLARIVSGAALQKRMRALPSRTRIRGLIDYASRVRP